MIRRLLNTALLAISLWRRGRPPFALAPSPEHPPACRAGCSHCCHQAVGVSAPEVLAIYDRLSAIGMLPDALPREGHPPHNSLRI
jgi:hypothetical protein